MTLAAEDKITIVHEGVIQRAVVTVVKEPGELPGFFSWRSISYGYTGIAASGLESLDKEGVRWIRGWHTRRSSRTQDELNALLVAWALSR